MTNKCKKCGKTLLSKEALYEHMKKWHKRLPSREKRELKKEVKK